MNIVQVFEVFIHSFKVRIPHFYLFNLYTQVEPPEIEMNGMPNLSFSAKKGTDLKAKAVLRGVPIPEAVWKRNGEPVKQTSRVNVENIDNYSTLTIKGKYSFVLCSDESPVVFDQSSQFISSYFRLQC